MLAVRRCGSLPESFGWIWSFNKVTYCCLGKKVDAENKCHICTVECHDRGSGTIHILYGWRLICFSFSAQFWEFILRRFLLLVVVVVVVVSSSSSSSCSGSSSRRRSSTSSSSSRRPGGGLHNTFTTNGYMTLVPSIPCVQSTHSIP